MTVQEEFAVEGFNPFDPEVDHDPYPWYAKLRRDDPVHYSAALDAYVLSRHADVLAGFRDVADFSSAPRGGTPDGVRFLLGSDPPEHTVLRRMVNRRFTPGAVSALTAQIETVAQTLTDRLLDSREGGVADYVEQVAGPLPVLMIARLLGIPDSRCDDFRRWADAMIGGVGLDPAGAARAFVELREYFLAVAAERLAAPGDDLISRLVTGVEPLTSDELWGFCTLLLIGGTETATNLIGNALAALLADPSLERRLRADPGLTAAFVEETLRYDAPVQAVWRLTRRQVAIGDATLPAGARVLLLQGSANRDEVAYADPDRFDLDRTAGPTHLSFGTGIHFCLGAPLARLEARFALQTLLARTGGLAPGGEPRRVSAVAEAAEAAQREGRVRRRSATARPRVRRNPIVRGFRALPVALS